MSTLTDIQRDQIDNMSHLEMCRVWRLGTSGDPLTTGPLRDYLSKRLQSFGGFTPDINRQLGWDVT